MRVRVYMRVYVCVLRLFHCYDNIPHRFWYSILIREIVLSIQVEKKIVISLTDKRRFDLRLKKCNIYNFIYIKKQNQQRLTCYLPIIVDGERIKHIVKKY